MLSSITPLGERGRLRNWRPTVVAFFVGSTLGGAAIGAVCGGAGAALRAGLDSAYLVVTAGVAAALVLARAVGRLPMWPRQVDESWLAKYRGWVVGFGYGAQLGAAVFTVVPMLLTWLVLVFAMATASAPIGAAVGAGFGLARALPLLLVAPVTTLTALTALHARLAQWARPIDRAASAQAAVAVAVLVTIAGVAK